jgi:hypothetical protein
MALTNCLIIPYEQRWKVIDAMTHFELLGGVYSEEVLTTEMYQEIEYWLSDQNIVYQYFGAVGTGMDKASELEAAYILFEKEEDMALFKLKWF